MRVTGDKLVEDDPTTRGSGSMSIEPVAPEMPIQAAPIEETKVPDRRSYERVVGQSGSTVQRRTTPPPVLVRLNRHKNVAHEEVVSRTADLDQVRAETGAGEGAFERFTFKTLVNGIVQGWQDQERALNIGAANQADRTYDEFTYHDDRVRYPEVLDERRANEDQDVEADVERLTSEERWEQQRDLEQRIREERVQMDRDSIKARSDAVSERNRRSSSDGGREDEYYADERYFEHNRLRR